MFPSVGETGYHYGPEDDFGEAETAAGEYPYSVGFREPGIDHTFAQSHTPTPRESNNLDDDDDDNDNDSLPQPAKKMFWHALHIDKVQDLVPEEIRWFYKEDPKAKWVAFIGYDSLRIECRYRALEYARLRSNSLEEEEIDTRIHVRGGLYEVDINNNVVHPVYWKGTSLPILRGTWFEDGTGQPLSYEYSLQLEQDHLAKFRGRSIPRHSSEEKRVTKSQVIHNVKFREFHVDWYDVDEVYKFSEAASSRMFRYVTTKLSFQKPGTGTRLWRGYYEEAKMDDKPPDVTHLIFVVHGVGQKYNQNRIISCCNDLRNGASKLLPKYFPDLTGSRHRVEFLPVEWRSDLELDGDLVESITPDKLKHLRVILNATAMDILYYTSPLYRGEIINGLSSEMNRLYGIFVERHPYFEANNGQVSICAHSLGSVILYDILTGWDPIELYDQYVCNTLRERSQTNLPKDAAIDSLTSSERSKKLHDFYIKSIVHKETSSLNFKVANVFSLGSPLGVFLTLRGMRPKPNGLMDHLLPKSLCKRFYNIYHPSDPVAYRIEPLVLRHYSTIAPLKLHRIYDPKKIPYSEMKAKAYAALGKAAKQVKKMRNMNSRESSPSASNGAMNCSPETNSPDDTPCSSPPPDRRMTSPSGATGGVLAGATVSSSSGGAPAHHSSNGAESHAAAEGHGGLSGAVKGFFSRLGGRHSLRAEKLTSELEDYSSITSEEETEETRSDDEDLVEHTDLEYRLDYVLPSSSMASSYVSAIFSHTSYWSSPEVALFLLSHIFPDYGPVE